MGTNSKTLYELMCEELAEFNLSYPELYHLYIGLIFMTHDSYKKSTQEYKGILYFVNQEEKCSERDIEHPSSSDSKDCLDV